MTYDPKAKDEDKLSQARQLFEDACEYRGDEMLEAHRAGRFLHNTNCRGQWEEGDYTSMVDDGPLGWLVQHT